MPSNEAAVFTMVPVKVALVVQLLVVGASDAGIGTLAGVLLTAMLYVSGPLKSLQLTV